MSKVAKMKSHYTLKEFLAMDAIKKDRLFRQNPALYNKLRKAADENYSTEEDTEALKELVSNPKTKKALE